MYCDTDNVDVNKIALGNEQNYIDTTYIPIYYNSTPSNRYSKLYLKTPRLFIKSNYFIKNGLKFLKLLLVDIENNVKIINYKLKFTLIENHINKLLFPYHFDFETMHFVNQINYDNYYNLDSQIIKLCDITKLYDINKQTINELITPCYIHTILEIKNIWIKKHKYGLNIIPHLIISFPSEKIPYPINFDINKININTHTLANTNNNTINNINNQENINNDVYYLYEKYDKMKLMGIPLEAIKHKIKLDGLDPELFIQKISIPPPPPMQSLKDDYQSIVYNQPKSLITSNMLNDGINMLKKTKPITKNKNIRKIGFNISIDDIKNVLQKMKTKKNLKNIIDDDNNYTNTNDNNYDNYNNNF